MRPLAAQSKSLYQGISSNPFSSFQLKPCPNFRLASNFQIDIFFKFTHSKKCPSSSIWFETNDQKSRIISKITTQN